MAKKIRFPLEMENGVMARSLEELRENFSLDKILTHYSSGKLMTWLKDRYENNIADSLEELDKDDSDFNKKLCSLFGVEYKEENVNLEDIQERTEKLKRLSKFTDEPEYKAVIDKIAFEQDDIYDLLDEGSDTIYLCGEKFSIPISQKGITYIGINKPVCIIDSKVKVDWEQRGIRFENVVFDDKYQALIVSETEKVDGVNIVKEYDLNYNENTYMSILMTSSDIAAAKSMFDKVANEIMNTSYSLDEDISKLKTKILEADIFTPAESFISKL